MGQFGRHGHEVSLGGLKSLGVTLGVKRKVGGTRGSWKAEGS